MAATVAMAAGMSERQYVRSCVFCCNGWSQNRHQQQEQQQEQQGYK
jgi:hypothetical protein